MSDFKLNLIQRSDNKSHKVRSGHDRQRMVSMQAAKSVSREKVNNSGFVMTTQVCGKLF